MAVERNLWAESFSREDPPSFLCPRCGRGRLSFDVATLKLEEPPFSVAAHKHDEWDPDWVIERFMGFFRCGIAKCGEVVVASGDTVIREVVDEEMERWVYE